MNDYPILWQLAVAGGAIAIVITITVIVDAIRDRRRPTATPADRRAWTADDEARWRAVPHDYNDGGGIIGPLPGRGQHE